MNTFPLFEKRDYYQEWVCLIHLVKQKEIKMKKKVQYTLRNQDPNKDLLASFNGLAINSDKTWTRPKFMSTT